MRFFLDIDGNVAAMAPPFSNTVPRDCWLSAGGKLRLICDLSDEHLGNILRQMQRRGDAIRHENIAQLEWCLVPRDKRAGVDQAAFYKLTPEKFLTWSGCNARLATKTWRNFVHPRFPHLNAEADRRGLQWNFIPDDMWGIAQDLLLLHAMSNGSIAALNVLKSQKE